MKNRLPWACAFVLVIAGAAQAQTYGNTEPFETRSNHSPNYVLGTEVVIPVDGLRLESFGLMYGHENSGDPLDSNARFALYTSGMDGLPETLVAATGEIFLTSQQTYDNIPFTEPAVVNAGTYWMMALYQSQAHPRMTLLDGNSLVAYWPNSYGNGFPNESPQNLTYRGQDFNYWVNGAAGKTCTYRVKKSKAKGGCEACPDRGDEFPTEAACENIEDCRKKIKTTIGCPAGPGSCKIKGTRDSCG